MMIIYFVMNSFDSVDDDYDHDDNEWLMRGLSFLKVYALAKEALEDVKQQRSVLSELEDALSRCTTVPALLSARDR